MLEKLITSRVFWGSILIFGGVLALLDNLGIVRIADLFWVIVTGIIAAFFISLFYRHGLNWWWLVPGFLFIGIAVSILLNWLLPSIGAQWSNSIVLLFLGISFIIVYFAEKQHWWTIILGGTLLDIGILAGLNSMLSETQGIGLFIIGLGITFTLVALLPTPVGSMNWAWIPSGILYVSGIVFLLSQGMILFYIVPLLIIFLGIILIVRFSKQQPQGIS